MALGGGVFVAENKILPGSYLNFISASRASVTLSDRGIAALPIEMDWGVDGEVFTVEVSAFQKESMKIFGFDYTHDKLKGLRDLFKNIKTAYLYKLNTGGNKASNDYGQAKYTGTRGNDLKIVIQNNEESTEENKIYDVSTYLGTLKVDFQTVKTAAELTPNEYVTFTSSAELALTVGTALAGGTNGTITNASYQTFLDKIESYSFNVVGCLSSDEAVKGLFAAFTKRMRDEVGAKFQCVLHRFTEADYEGVVSVENNTTTEMVYWVTGVEAGCSVNKSNTNKVYDGAFMVDVDYTQSQLETAIKSGKFMFHKVADNVRVLDDINSFVSHTDEKNADFANNQTVRVLDQIGNDIAALFNTKYLGQIPNDGSGRISLWNDIVKHHQELQSIRAIENFNPDHVTVEAGDTNRSVVVSDKVTPVNAMAQLYMTIVVQ